MIATNEAVTASTNGGDFLTPQSKTGKHKSKNESVALLQEGALKLKYTFHIGIHEWSMKRLQKKIPVERGHIAGELDIKHLLREPMKMFKEGKSEFRVRLCKFDDEFINILSETKFDDIYLITNKSSKEIDFFNSLPDVNVEKIETTEIKEIKYLFSLISNL